MGDLRHRAVKLPIRVETTGSKVAGVRFASGGTMPAALRKQFARYFAGRPVKFRVLVDLSAGTPFQQCVWRVLQMIPYGQTRSYAWVAQKIGKPKAARAVGAACGANPLPVIIPCHRVIASDGTLGGYSGGLHWKKRLLKLEGTLPPP